MSASCVKTSAAICAILFPRRFAAVFYRRVRDAQLTTAGHASDHRADLTGRPDSRLKAASDDREIVSSHPLCLQIQPLLICLLTDTAPLMG